MWPFGPTRTFPRLVLAVETFGALAGAATLAAGASRGVASAATVASAAAPARSAGRRVAARALDELRVIGIFLRNGGRRGVAPPWWLGPHAYRRRSRPATFARITAGVHPGFPLAGVGIYLLAGAMRREWPPAAGWPRGRQVADWRRHLVRRVRLDPVQRRAPRAPGPPPERGSNAEGAPRRLDGERRRFPPPGTDPPGGKVFWAQPCWPIACWPIGRSCVCQLAGQVRTGLVDAGPTGGARDVPIGRWPLGQLGRRPARA